VWYKYFDINANILKYGCPHVDYTLIIIASSTRCWMKIRSDFGVPLADHQAMADAGIGEFDL
jgi:hypothetical protein